MNGSIEKYIGFARNLLSVIPGLSWKADSFALTDGVTAPETVAGLALLYVDTSDGDLKIKFGDGAVVVIPDAAGTLGTTTVNDAAYVNVSGDTMTNDLTIERETSGDPEVNLRGFAVNPAIQGFRANGTISSPTVSTADQAMVTLAGRGYATSGFTALAKAAIFLMSGETWSDTNQGTYIRFDTTPNASTTRAERMRINDSGIDVTGTVRGDGLRLDVSPTAETITPTHTITISVNGTNYKIPLVAA